MKLAAMNLYRYTLPLVGPLALKRATLRRREGILVELISESGAKGWGEAAPLPGFSWESPDEAACDLAGLREFADEWEIPADHPPDSQEVFLHGRDLVPSARFGLDLALWNLRAAVQGRGLHELLAETPAKTVALNGLLTGSPEEVLREARRMVRAGYRAVKLKAGRRSVEEDVELVRALDEVLGGETALRLDANRAWSMDEALEFARRAPAARIEYIEEPLADPTLLPRYASFSGMPIALDESLVGMAPEDLASHAYARAVVLKPTLLGGVANVMRLASLARRLSITPVISSSYESGVGTLGLIALASALGDAPAGLDTYRRFGEDVIQPPLDLSSPFVAVASEMRVRREIAHHSLKPIG